MGTYNRHEKWVRRGGASGLALLLAMAGCAGASATDDGVEPVLAQQKKPDGTVELRPQGVYFAEVTASGTGCPAGSWTSSISSDGQVFTNVFSSYEVSVSSEVRNATRDCAIVMKLHSDQPREFAVLSVFYSGYAFLEDGVTGRQTVRYGFHGASADAGNSRKEFTGPVDADFAFRDDVGVDKQKWSGCGTDQELTASTQLVLQGKGTKASGYINVLAVDGDAAPKLELKLGWRACKTKPNTSTTTPSTGATTPSTGNAKGNGKS